jgi:hypothetical protein
MVPAWLLIHQTWVVSSLFGRLLVDRNSLDWVLQVLETRQTEGQRVGWGVTFGQHGVSLKLSPQNQCRGRLMIRFFAPTIANLTAADEVAMMRTASPVLIVNVFMHVQRLAG